MSQQTEQVEDSTETVESILEAFEDWYHVPVLAAAIAFMLWVRLQSYDRFLRGGEVFFAGNDAWYHFRQVQYTVNNWPATMPFDPWTYFPYGTSVGQFGTLFDQLVATAALVVGLGSPSEQTVALTLLVAPAVIGALVVIPTYVIGKRLGGRLGGLFGVLLLALMPGTFLRRSLVGFGDHHIAEVLFQVIAVFAMMVAVTVAERERPVYELLADRDFAALRNPLGYSVLAGFATALYLWSWPPGVLLVGIFGVFFAIKLAADYVRGVSPDHLAFVGATSMAVTGFLALVPLGTFDFSATKFSLLQPLLAFAVAGGCAFMAWLAREWDDRDIDSRLYPAAIGGIVLAIVGVIAVALPDLFGLIRNNVIRVVGFSTGARTRTIGEAQPFLSRAQPQYGIEWYDVIVQEYGLMLFTAVVAAAWMVWRTYRTNDHRAEYLLVLVWSAFIFAAAFTQVRFNYYLVVPVAVLNAYLVGRAVSVLDLADRDFTDREAFTSLEGYQVLAIVFVVLLVIPVLVVPANVGNSGYDSVDKTRTAMTAGGQTGPGAVTQWDGSLKWMANETPEEGTYGGEDNAMEYYGTYSQEEDDFSYDEGAYGVMSWWDYGHWITVQGERIPNANPFQEGAKTAAEYLLAPSESDANAVVDELGDDHEETRYVMVDWQMAEPSSKFSAPTVFHDDVDQWDFTRQVYQETQNGYQLAFQMKNQRYYESQAIRLYLYHGSSVEPSPVVVDYDPISGASSDRYVQMPTGQDQPAIREFDTMEEARQFVEEDGSAQIGGIGSLPSERIPALQHYRLVKQSEASGASDQQHAQTLQRELMLLNQSGIDYGQAQQMLFRTSPSWVKTFERVPGATVEGTGPENTTVTAQVQMSPEGTQSSFTYTQQAETGSNGEFEMTLPYSSTGYDEWGPEEGYTNTSVRATGPYQFYTPLNQTDNDTYSYYNDTAAVTEGQVIGEDGESVSVELTEETIESQPDENETAPPANETDAANESDPATENESVDNDSENQSALASPDDSTPVRAGFGGAYAAALLVAGRN